MVVDIGNPQNCYECLIRNQGYSGDGMKCGKTGSVISWYDGNRQCMPDCPLKGDKKIMNKLEKAKEIIKEHFKEGDCGIYDSRNIVGDLMTNIYNDGELVIDVCYTWNYFEVFGLSDDEFDELARYYNKLGGI